MQKVYKDAAAALKWRNLASLMKYWQMAAIRGFLVVIAALLVASSPVWAASIGISPGRVEFDNLLKSGYAERTLTITTNSEQTIGGHFKITGEIKDWLRFQPNTTTFELSGGKPYKLKLIIEPPPDVRRGNYSGSIEFVTDTAGKIAGRAGGIIKTAVILMVRAEVTGDEVIKCRAGGFSFKDVEEGFPLELGLTVINDGNVRLKPTIAVDIWDQLQENLLSSRQLLGEEVLPTTEKKMLKLLPNDLDVGQYWVNLEVKECLTEDLLTFSVVEKGGIADKGKLQGILTKPVVSLGETVEIIAKFANEGERVVYAKFRGTIRQDDRIVEVIESEELVVPSGEVADFSVYFTPEKPGRYAITGRVIYNKKLTFEKGAVLNVNPPEEEKRKLSIFPLLIYLAIIITIIFMARKIMKDRRKRWF
jgi:hypothetical protein